MFLLRDKLIMQGERQETSTQTCNETMLRAKLRVFVSHILLSIWGTLKCDINCLCSETRVML